MFTEEEREAREQALVPVVKIPTGPKGWVPTGPKLGRKRPGRKGSKDKVKNVDIKGKGKEIAGSEEDMQLVPHHSAASNPSASAFVDGHITIDPGFENGGSRRCERIYGGPPIAKPTAGFAYGNTPMDANHNSALTTHHSVPPSGFFQDPFGEPARYNINGYTHDTESDLRHLAAGYGFPVDGHIPHQSFRGFRPPTWGYQGMVGEPHAWFNEENVMAVHAGALAANNAAYRDIANAAGQGQGQGQYATGQGQGENEGHIKGHYDESGWRPVNWQPELHEEVMREDDDAHMGDASDGTASTTTVTAAVVNLPNASKYGGRKHSRSLTSTKGEYELAEKMLKLSTSAIDLTNKRVDQDDNEPDKENENETEKEKENENSALDGINKHHESEEKLTEKMFKLANKEADLQSAMDGINKHDEDKKNGAKTEEAKTEEAKKETETEDDKNEIDKKHKTELKDRAMTTEQQNPDEPAQPMVVSSSGWFSSFAKQFNT